MIQWQTVATGTQYAFAKWLSHKVTEVKACLKDEMATMNWNMNSIFACSQKQTHNKDFRYKDTSPEWHTGVHSRCCSRKHEPQQKSNEQITNTTAPTINPQSLCVPNATAKRNSLAILTRWGALQNW